jgi:hypothetical protein
MLSLWSQDGPRNCSSFLQALIPDRKSVETASSHFFGFVGSYTDNELDALDLDVDICIMGVMGELLEENCIQFSEQG